jgi:MarR family transcriptional regulator for hemolysin
VGGGRSPMHLLRDVTRTFGRVQRKAFSCCGPATETQCLILTALDPGETVPVSEIGTRLGVDLAWVSRTVEQLRLSGDVQRLADPSDRRVALVRLTPQGEARAEALHATLEAHSEAILHAIPENSRADVLSSLELLQTALRSAEASQEVVPSLTLVRENHQN